MDPKSVTIIAGPGSEKKIRDIATFVTNFGGKPEDWTKRTAKIESSAYVHDVHWFEMNHVQYRPVMKFRKVKK
jgi:hypothetical protein